jgi:hypothetical protein
LVISLTVAAASAAAAGKRDQGSLVDRLGDKGRIDWEKGLMTATGLGAVSSREPNSAKAYLRARTFAKLDALRNLLMAVDHVKIDSRTVGADFEAQSDEIRAEIKGIVKGAQVISERNVKVGRDTMIEVTVATPLYGEDGLAGIIVPELAKRARMSDSIDTPPTGLNPGSNNDPEIPSLPQPRPVRPRPQPSPTPVDPFEPQIGNLLPIPDDKENYTSVIIDARGLQVERCMSPKIRRADGSEIWGTVSADLDYVIEHGIVGYARSMAEALENHRAGSRPLILRAVGRQGGRFNSDPVLSETDAARLLNANRRSGFLGRYRVIFLVDPAR